MVSPKKQMDQTARAQQLQAQLKRAGLKMTPQRLAVYEYLLGSQEHPCAETVFRDLRPTFPTISLDTVNRTLLTLSRVGAAFVVEGTGDAKRFDANLDNHQHFKCIKCKRIIDFHHGPFDNVPVPSCIGEKFTVLRKTVYFEGLCDQCQTDIQS